MLIFDPKNPFPLLASGSHTYAEAQLHAEHVDTWLGLRTYEVEASLEKRKGDAHQQLWIGLPIVSMLTPYTELREILERLGPKAGESAVDLGAGYGRMAFVLARHYPGTDFLGYEFVTERVKESRRALECAGI